MSMCACVHMRACVCVWMRDVGVLSSLRKDFQGLEDFEYRIRNVGSTSLAASINRESEAPG